MERKKISKRYIEVEPLIELIDEYIEEYDTLEDGYHNPKWCAMQEARRSIEKQPIVDVVEVIRCKNCYMYRKDAEIAEANNFNPDIYCALHQTEMPENGYCNYGKNQIEKQNNEVISCSECKHLMEDGRCYEFIDDNIQFSENDYCSYGEQKNE